MFWGFFHFYFNSSSFCSHFTHFISFISFPRHTVLTCFCCWYCVLNGLFTASTANTSIYFMTSLVSKQTHLFSPHILFSCKFPCKHNTETYKTNRLSFYVVVIFFYVCVLFVFNFMFCRQLNGTGRFHGLASLDDITAIISTPPLAGLQVASPNWCLN